MKKIYLLSSIAIATVAFIFSGCQKKPTACFTPSTISATAGTPVSFSNCSTDGKSFTWNFGDGGSSKEESPVHVYTTAGTYIVSLEAASKNGKKKDLISKTVTVAPSSPGPGNATLLTSNVLTAGTLVNPGDTLWYYFNATNGSTYNVMWDDSYEGSGTYTADIKVSAYRQDKVTTYFYDDDSGYYSPSIVVAAATEKVYIMVTGYSSSNTGTFGIKFY